MYILTLKDKNWEFVGFLNQIVKPLGKEFFKNFDWKIYLNDSNLTIPGIEYDRKVDIKTEKIFEIMDSKIQLIDAAFYAYKDKKLEFTILAVDTTYWDIKSESKEWIKFFENKFKDSIWDKI